MKTEWPLAWPWSPDHTVEKLRTHRARCPGEEACSSPKERTFSQRFPGAAPREERSRFLREGGWRGPRVCAGVLGVFFIDLDF